MAYLLLILTTLFWAGNFVLARGVHDIIPPVTLAFWRWGLAMIIFLPFSIRPLIRHKESILAHWKFLALLSVLSVTNFNMFVYIALQSTTVINSALIQSFTPMMIVFLSWVGFRERITLRQGSGVLLSFCGLLWIISRGDSSVLLTLRFSTGDLWAVAACVSWAIYSVLLRLRPQDISQAALLEILIIFGTIFLFPFYIWELSTKPVMQISTVTLGSILYVAIFPSVLSYLFWNKAVSMIGANKSGIFVNLMPVFSIALAFVFIGERFSGFHLFGIVLIFSGIVLTTYGKVKSAYKGSVKCLKFEVPKCKV